MFGKDEEGCIHPDEIKFVLSALPSELEGEEIQEMIEIVDRNKDGKISYSEFRVREGAGIELARNLRFHILDTIMILCETDDEIGMLTQRS